jgi:predicted RNA-binding protein with PUA-like domain
MKYWLVKSEPETYSWARLVKEGRTAWTGVRNFAARLHLRAMAKGDRVLFYHSGAGKEIVGVARVGKTAYRDPTAIDGDWSCVDLVPVKAFRTAVNLQRLKADNLLKEMVLVRQSRLSVSPVTRAQFERVLQLAGTKL